MPSTEDAEQAFPGDGEMTRRMRAHDWAATPLGEPSQWPSSLQTACRICLTWSFPMVVWWGEDLVFLFNDAYRPFLGSKHPALAKAGSEVWTEIWGTIGPMLTSVLRSGQPTWSKDELLLMNRHGYWEETYWTWSFSPLHDDAGAVRGVFTVATDATQRVIGERRMALLTTLSALAGGVHSVPEACERVTRALGRAGKDVPFAAVYLRRHDARRHSPGLSQPARCGARTPAGRTRRVAGNGGPAQRPADQGRRRRDLASLFRPAVEKAGLRFEVDCPPLPEPVYVDRGMWEEIVLNLLGTR